MRSLLDTVSASGRVFELFLGPAVPNVPQPGLVSGKMQTDQIASLLVQHGIRDITDQVVFPGSCQPFANGGFGSVYRGELRDGRLVAIKYIEIRNGGKSEPKGDCSKHAAHELYTWSKCDHPGVLKPLGFTLSGGSIQLISPWVQNGALSGHLGPNNSHNRLKFCIDLASTVEYLHRNGIVHGDIKTDNIILSDRGGIQLVDFGSAALVHYPTLCFTATSPQLACSIRFAAPEILLGNCETHTTESDVYSLGMTILQILTGELPYAGESDVAVILAKAANKSPTPRPMADGILRNQHANNSLWDLLLSCWDHIPSRRPTSADVKWALINIERESDF